MSSSARFLAAAALVLAVSLAPKILARGEAPSAPPALGSEPIPMWLGAFLADQGAQGLAKVRHRPGMPEWPGWSFTAGGCKGLAFPASPNGDLYVAARLHARPGDRIRYIYNTLAALAFTAARLV